MTTGSNSPPQSLQGPAFRPRYHAANSCWRSRSGTYRQTLGPQFGDVLATLRTRSYVKP